MPAARRVRARFRGATPASSSDEVGVELDFAIEHRGFETDAIKDFAAIGPEHCVPAVEGLGKVLRILRAARIAAPASPGALVDETDEVARLLERAVGTPLLLELKPRTRLRFVAWMEDRVEVIENVAEVVETPDAYLVSLTGGRFPLRIPRDEVIRQLTETQRWFEILSIERG